MLTLRELSSVLLIFGVNIYPDFHHLWSAPEKPLLWVNNSEHLTYFTVNTASQKSMSVTTSECFEKQWDNTWLIMLSFTFPHCAFVMLSRNLVLFESLVSRATISLWPQQQTKGSVVNVFEFKAVKTVCSCSDESSVLKDDPHQTHTIHHSVHVSLSLCSQPV